jgi:hypothetical protein
MLWQRFVQNRSQFFVEREDGFCTIRCLTSFAGASVSAVWKQEMRRFAAVAALLCINGHNPMPLSPAIILFIVYGTDLHCLTPAFIGEWFVNPRKRLLDWLVVGPDGNLQPFAGYFALFHDIEAGFDCMSYDLLMFKFLHLFCRYQHISIMIIPHIRQLRLICYTLLHLGLPHTGILSGQISSLHLIFPAIMASGLPRQVHHQNELFTVSLNAV